ncbi:MAG: PAS domain S-box protein [Deltaproteobacteria bacterium]|nr:PAS domain S-box protein [Deltaproteobacteria bacterium]
MNKLNEIDMEKRLAYLEQANLFKMMALDLTKELGEFNSSINRLENPGIVFEKCNARARQIVGFKQIAFFLVDEDNSDFHLTRCYPETGKDKIEKEIDVLIEDGTFSRAVLEKKPVTAYSKDFNHQLLLHVLATVSRVRGMFAGVLEKKSKHIPEASFELLSILMAHCANTLESFELYYQLRTSNRCLKDKVNELAVSESCLKREIKEHRKTETALKSSEKLYRLLTETASEIIIMVSDNGQILYLNQSAQKACGYSKKAVEAMSIKDLIDDFDNIMADHAHSYSNTHDAKLLSRCGDKISMEINIESIPNKGAPPGILIVGRDISERLNSEKEKKFLEEKLWQSQKMESIGILAGGIAHDFNNILSVIVNYSSLSLSCLPKESPVYSHLEKVQTASNRAVDLARKLYTIGRKDDHKKHIIDMVSTINETIDLLRSSLGKGIEIKTGFEKTGMHVLAEETRIQQIIMNLITNAAHAIADRKGIITVCASKTRVLAEKPISSLDLAPGKYIELCISDNGPGIDTNILQHVFEPYFSTKKGKDNSGLGLAVVHGIVKNYHGAIDIRTKMGQGTSFHIYLPEALF